MKLNQVVFLLLIAACSTTLAFVVPHSTTTPPLRERISDIDEMCMENVANLCLQELDCDLEEYDALVTTLEEQRDLHLDRVDKINSLLYKLRNHEGTLNRDPEQVDKLKHSLEEFIRMEVRSI